jgi:hypothetical protein
VYAATNLLKAAVNAVPPRARRVVVVCCALALALFFLCVWAVAHAAGLDDA